MVVVGEEELVVKLGGRVFIVTLATTSGALASIGHEAAAKDAWHSMPHC
jgi:hypothetical protein